MSHSLPAPRRLVPACASLLVLALAACSGSDAPAKPSGSGEFDPGARPTGVDAHSAILITLDTTRPDALGCYGVHEGVTPNLDRIAEESLVYEFAHSVAPITLPAHASMLTGLYPPRHTLRDNGFQALPSTASTLAEAARDAGHQTAAFIASTVLDRAFGLDQGFETFKAPPRPEQQTTAHFPELNGVIVAEDAKRWVEGRDRTRPFFLWVHVFDPHAPYKPPPKLRELTEKHPLYYGEVAYVDDALAGLLDLLREEGTLDQATLLVVGDHGESLKEHREETHTHFCYESTLRVPFLIRYPDGHRQGERSEEVVSVVDVYPTIMEVLGLSFSTQQDGISLYRQQAADDRGVYFESYTGYIAFGWSPIAGWLDLEGKYIHSTEPEFYNSLVRPRELKNEIATTTADLERYKRMISEMVARGALEVDPDASIDPSLSAAVAGLGYTGGGPLPTEMPHPLADTGLPSPASMVDVFFECQKGLAYAEAGMLPQAVQLFQKVLVRNPRNWLALERLGLSLYNMGKPAEAIPHLRLAVSEGPQRAGTYFNLGIALCQTGSVEDGLEAMERATELDRTERVFVQGLVQVNKDLGRPEDVAKWEARLRELLSGR